MNNFRNDDFFSLYTGANINADTVVGFMSPTKVSAIQGYLDKGSVLESMFNKYDEKSHVVHLGMINLMKNVNQIRLPQMFDLLKESSVLTIPAEGAVTYDLPIPRDPQDVAYVKVDTSKDEEEGALFADVPFKLILDRPYTAGDLLKPDPSGFYQVEVSREIPVEPYGGGAYLHYVVFRSNGDGRKTFPKPFLREGQPWFKIGHKNGEYGIQFSTVSLVGSAPGYMTLRWTPSSPTTIETAITRSASLMATEAAAKIQGSTLEKIQDSLIGMGGFDKRGLFISGDVVKTQDGKTNLQVKKIDQTLEYLAMAELHKMEAWTNMFATASVTTHGGEGVVKVNDGLWRQKRRGKVIEYARAGGLTLADLAEAANYIYGNSDVAIEDRYIVFTGGKMAVTNGEQLLQAHASEYLTATAQLIGHDSLLDSKQKLVEGDLDNLTLKNDVKFKQVFLPGVGNVSFNHDPSFDWNLGTTSSRVGGFVGKGYNRNSYTLMAEAKNKRSTMVEDKVKGAKLVDGGKKDNPIYLVQPDHPYITWGRTQGRMNAGSQFTNVQSALKYMGQEFWAIADSDVLLVDTTACVVIELKDTYLYE